MNGQQQGEERGRRGGGGGGCDGGCMSHDVSAVHQGKQLVCESSCQEGEREQGEGGARSLFFFSFFVSHLHPPPPSSPLPPSVI